MKRLRELKGEFVARWRLSWELQELWLQTRHRTETESRLADALHELALQKNRIRFRIADWQAAYAAAQAQVPSRWRIFVARLNVLSLRMTYTRQDLNNFWHQTREHWTRRAYLRINWPLATWYLVRDVAITTRFALNMAFRTQ